MRGQHPGDVGEQETPSRNSLLVDLPMAVTRLLAGGVVAIPTETVYGLAAVATDEAAVARVFAIKGRPATNPLIVHIADGAELTNWASHVPPAALALAQRYWPGPLTLVLDRAPGVSAAITAGQQTVALRVPDHPTAAALLSELARTAGRPIALVAPSANTSGSVSPTSAEHVLTDLGARLGPGDGVLDGGRCLIGVESTIVDARSADLRVLRPGAIDVVGSTSESAVAEDLPVVPGSRASHYAPRAEVVVVTNPDELKAPDPAARLGLLAPAEVETPTGYLRLAAPQDDEQFARDLYAALHAADAAGLTRVVVLAPPTGRLRAAILDRLTRAAAAR